MHGIGVSHRYLRPLAEALARAGCAVLAPDLPGFGSSPTPGHVLGVEEHADVVAGLLAAAATPDRPAVLVGHSMGAQVVTAVAAAHRALVRRVVLVGPVVEPGARGPLRQAARLLRDTWHEAAAANAVVLTDYARAGPRRYLATVPSMLVWRLEEHLGEVMAPVVLVRGARDPVASAAYVHGLAVRAREAVVVEVPGEGHVAMWRRPDVVVPWCLAEPPAPDVARPAVGRTRHRPRDVLARAWWWALDYAWVTARQVGGLARRGGAEGLARPRPDVPTRPPVVLVPGVYEPWSFLRPLADRLHARGHPVHVLPGPGWNSGPLDEAAALLGEHLRAADLWDVVVVAHSKGGPVGKLAMLREDPDGRVVGMVAVATPFGGSVYARYLPLRSVRVLAPTDATLRALGAELDVNARITSVWSRFDPHVPGGSALTGAVEVELGTPGHFRVLADPRLDAVGDEAVARYVPGARVGSGPA